MRVEKSETLKFRVATKENRLPPVGLDFSLLYARQLAVRVSVTINTHSSYIHATTEFELEEIVEFVDSLSLLVKGAAESARLVQLDSRLFNLELIRPLNSTDVEFRGHCQLNGTADEGLSLTFHGILVDIDEVWQFHSALASFANLGGPEGP